MSLILTHLLTAQEFGQLPESNLHRELVRGEVVEIMPPGGQHGAIAVMIAMLLRLWAKEEAGGYVGVEAGYILARQPDTVRGPDVSYVHTHRIPVDGVPEGFWDLAPDLAVEVVSPHESADEVRAKIRDFLNAGTPMVWTIYPRGREVIVHTPDGLARTYTSTMKLEFPKILPGFACTVAELFE